MNINYQPNVTTSFNGINSKIMDNFANFQRGCRERIARHYPILKDSDVVDLTYDTEGNIILKTKKNLKKVIDGNTDLPAGSKIEWQHESESFIRGSKLICQQIKINGENKNIELELGPDKMVQKVPEIMSLGYSEFLYSILPALGSLIDTSYKMSGILAKIKGIMMKCPALRNLGFAYDDAEGGIILRPQKATARLLYGNKELPADSTINVMPSKKLSIEDSNLTCSGFIFGRPKVVKAVLELGPDNNSAVQKELSDFNALSEPLIESERIINKVD